MRSFDVFDTVLLRRIGSPRALIDELAVRLAARDELPVPAAVFAGSRQRYETGLTPVLGRHASLREIYAAVARALVVPGSWVERWATAEEDLEREMIVPVPGVAGLLATARRSGPVLFVSDTPHSESFVHELLAMHQLAVDGDRVFTSSERQVSKLHGGLFHAVRADLDRDVALTHTGDNARSDVAGARVEGWRASHRPQAQLNRYEHLLDRDHASDGVTAWLAGSARIARLEAVSRGTAPAIADVASGVLGPMVVGFALWVVAQARARGITRLYYVARDGEVMLKAARHVLGTLAPDIELRYLYASRKPWIFGACASSEDFLPAWVAGRPDYTARTLLARVDLTPEDVFARTSLPMCSPDRADDRLSSDERAELATALQREPLVALVRAGASVAAESTIGYLRQEGLADGVPSALVDVGWGQTTVFAVDELLRSADMPPVTHLFMGIRGSTQGISPRVPTTMEAWLFDDQQRPGSSDGIPAPHTLFEVLCAGSTGRTLAYHQVEGTYEPLLASESNEPLMAWGLAEVQDVAERVSQLASAHLTPPAMHVDLVDVVTSVLLEFWVHPRPVEVEAWGSFPWEEEIWEPFTPLAQRVTTRSVVGRFLRGDTQVRRTSSWRAGSAQVSAQPWRALLQFRGWQDEHRARLQRLPRRLRLEVASRSRQGRVRL